MSRRAKATLCVSLRNNDALRVNLQMADGSAHAKHGATWEEVLDLLKNVMPAAEMRRHQDAFQARREHLGLLKQALGIQLPASPQTHLETLQPSGLNIQPSDQKMSSLGISPSLAWPTPEAVAKRLADTAPASDKARLRRIQRLRLGTPPARFLAALLSWWRPV